MVCLSQISVDNVNKQNMLHANKPILLGFNEIKLEVVNSTNLFLQELLSKTEPPEGTIVITDYQTHGKGQIGRKWESERGVNLLCSILLKPTFLDQKHLFFLNIITALAIADVVEKFTRATCQVKWPNDVMVNDRKISGILIQNVLAGSQVKNTIIGIGLNVNQTTTPTDQAISIIHLAGEKISLKDVKATLLHRLESYYLTLKRGELQQIKQLYLRKLYRRDTEHKFLNIKENETFTGTITGVDEDGKLMIKTGNNTTKWTLNEVKYI